MRNAAPKRNFPGPQEPYYQVLADHTLVEADSGRSVTFVLGVGDRGEPEFMVALDEGVEEPEIYLLTRLETANLIEYLQRIIPCLREC